MAQAYSMFPPARLENPYKALYRGENRCRLSTTPGAGMGHALSEPPWGNLGADSEYRRELGVSIVQDAPWTVSVWARGPALRIIRAIEA